MLSITRDGDFAGLFRPVMSVSLRKNRGRQHGNDLSAMLPASY